MGFLRTDAVVLTDKPFTLYVFSNPMFHEDWHTVDEMGLKYLSYEHLGPDYWDDVLYFVKEDDYEIAEELSKYAW